MMPASTGKLSKGAEKLFSFLSNEERFIAQYMKLTGANETLARNVYILLEPSHYRAFP